MSFKSMLKHQCTIRRLTEHVEDGSSNWVLSDHATEVQCFVDLAPLTQVNPYYAPEGGRPTQRAGKVFFAPLANGDCPVISGDFILVTKGPPGTFRIEAIMDDIWKPSKRHHYEIGVTEVAPQIARSQVSR